MSKIIPIYRHDWRFSSKTQGLLIALLMTCISLLLSFAEEKKYKVELPIQKWQQYFSGLQATKQQLKNSDLPARTVNFIVDSVLTPLTAEMESQLNKQLLADTVKKK